MKKRVISGVVYTAILLGFFLLKICLPQPWGNLAFDALICFFAVVGTHEMLRASSALITGAEKAIVTVFSAICVPACAVCEAFFGLGIYAVFGCVLALALALLCLLVFKNEETKLQNVGTSFVCAIYPTVLLCVLVLTNHLASVEGSLLADSILAMLFIFIVSPMSDVAAFFTGMSLRKKFPKKFAPTISPNKTVVGFIGGIIGGGLAGVGIYFIYNAICGSYDKMYLALPVYLIVGLAASVASAFGDVAMIPSA